MKLTRSIIVTVALTLFAFTAFIYTSCTKNKCTNTTCQNGGSCANGFCTCPAGYSGDNCEIPATANIQYFNRTFTPITLTINNVAYTIPSGMSKGFTGKYGDSLNGNAFTSGPYGETINWDTVDYVFPENGTQVVYFDVDTNYFYLAVVNDSSHSIIKEIDVNEGQTHQRNIILPPPYLTYPGNTLIGYFYASPSSTVYLKSTTLWGFSFPEAPATQLYAEPMTVNQLVTVYAGL